MVKIPSRVHRPDRHIHLVHLLPRPLEIRPSWPDHLQLRVRITLAVFFSAKVVADRGIKRRLARDPLRLPECCNHRPLVLLDGEKTPQHNGHHDPTHDPNDNS